MFLEVEGVSKSYDNGHVRALDGAGFAVIPFDCPDALIAIISDFILSLDVVDISVIYAIRRDGIKFSVRSERKDIDAGALVKQALEGLGSGGGHKSMAGGFIPSDHMEAVSGQPTEWIERMFMRHINR